MTSPVERISGPRTVSTPRPSEVAEPVERHDGLLDGDRRVQRQVPPSPLAGSRPSARSSATVAPSEIRAAALASGTAVAFEVKGTVREARGLASRT